MKQATKLYKFTSGWKTIAAAVSAPVLAWMVGRGYMDADTMMMVSASMAALGIGDKVRKAIKK